MFSSFFLKKFIMLKYGKTALHFAAYSGFEEILKILLKSGSDIDLQDEVLIFFSFFVFYFFSFLLVFLSYFFLFLLIAMGCV